MRLAYHVFSAPSPIGLLFLAASGRGLRCLEFLDRRSIKRVIAAKDKAGVPAEWHASLLELKPIADELDAYFNGSLTRFQVPLDPEGSEFQRAVWRELLKIPYGETRTYGQIAKAIGQPGAARAVGLANNQNPLAIVVPCHRVVGSDGDLTGYGGGLPRKRWLLEHEAKFSRATLMPGENISTLHVPEPARRAAERARQLSLFTEAAAARRAADREGARRASLRRPLAKTTAPAKAVTATNSKSAPATKTHARIPAKKSSGAARPARSEKPRGATTGRGAPRRKTAPRASRASSAQSFSRPAAAAKTGARGGGRRA
jgi:O-6-methylguanine DNA methyltransferase